MQPSRSARRQAQSHHNKREWRSWAITMGSVVVGTLLVLLFVAVLAVVDGHSMEPGLHGGERMLVWRLQYAFAQPQRGDIVMCYYPHTGNMHYIKRVIGLPGETLEIRNGKVLIDGVALAEGYIDERPAVDLEPVTLRAREYFVMGDNRNHSTDSRDPRIGPIPAERIAGKAVAVIWPLSRLHTISKPYYEGYQPYGAMR